MGIIAFNVYDIEIIEYYLSHIHDQNTQQNNYRKNNNGRSRRIRIGYRSHGYHM